MAGFEHEHCFEVFGTHARVLLYPDSPAARLDALRVQTRMRRLHHTLTRFDPDSELCRLNARTGEPVVVTSTLLRAVQAAIRAARLSDGLVDPTILDDLELAGYAASRSGFEPAPLDEALSAAPARRPATARRDGRWASVQVEPGRSTISLPRGVRIDLGGSAKGLAVDLATELLAGYASYAVDAGGDIRIGGPRTVRISHPLSDEIALSFTVTSGAVATSGLRTRVWRNERGFAHHLIDPARGTPAWTGVIQATAIAPTALEAEALAKTALLSGPHAGKDVLARHGGALVLDDGRLRLAGALTALPDEVAA